MPGWPRNDSQGRLEARAGDHIGAAGSMDAPKRTEEHRDVLEQVKLGTV